MNPAYGPTPGGPPGSLAMQSRFTELLEQLRAEYDLLVDENRGYHSLRDDYQHKVEQQVAELSVMEQSLVDLDRKHQMMKDQYEAEIARQKAAAAAAGVLPPPSSVHDAPPPVQSGSAAAVATGRGGGASSSLPGVLSAVNGTSTGDANVGVGSAVPGALADPSSTGPPGAMGGLTSGLGDPSAKPHGGSLVGVMGVVGGGPGAGGTSMGHDSAGVRPDGITTTANGPDASGVGASMPGQQKRLGQLTTSNHGFGSNSNSNGGSLLPQGAGQGSGHLSGMPSLPSASHAPSLASVGAGPRLMSSSDVPPMMKKESLLMTPGALTSAQQTNSNGILGSGPAGMNASGTQGTGDDDYIVYPGRTANGNIVDMKVSLQGSFPHDSVVCCVRYSWDGNYLATGSNRSAHIFDVNSGQRVAVFSKDDGTEMDDGSGSDSYVRAVCFSRDGNWLITGAEDHVVKVWDVRNRTVKHKLVGHDTDIYSVDASANGSFIISGSGDKKAKLWSLESGKLLSTLGGEYGPTDGITSVSVSPTSQHVAAGSLDKVVRVWDVESSRLVRQFEGHRDSVYSVAFSPDGRLLLSGSLDKTLKLWDLAASQPSQQCRLTFTGHKDFVLSVAFSPNGRWLISGSKDRTVQFWDPRQSTMCLMLQGHKNSVISIAHNPLAMSLATGSGDFRARLWNISEG